MAAQLSHDLPMFHDARPIHTHAICNGCLIFQRHGGGKLSRCMACSTVFYCSKKCQVSDWKSHKPECKRVQEEAARIKTDAGLETGYADLMEWMRYYEAPLKNCLIAALQLRTHPHAERNRFLFVKLEHKGAHVTKGPGVLPASRRFKLVGLELAPALRMMTEGYDAACDRGRIEQGADFYGIGQFYLSADFIGHGFGGFAMYLKRFAIDRATAHASGLAEDWAGLLKQYVDVGAKLRFCCGRIRGVDKCCCGGWVHDEEKKKAFKATFTPKTE